MDLLVVAESTACLLLKHLGFVVADQGSSSLVKGCLATKAGSVAFEDALSCAIAAIRLVANSWDCAEVFAAKPNVDAYAIVGMLTVARAFTVVVTGIGIAVKFTITPSRRPEQKPVH